MKLSRSNKELQLDVWNAIKWEPLLNTVTLEVFVKDAVVTLSGTVDNYAKKISAVKVAKSVVGVHAVRSEIGIDFGNLFRKDDAEIKHTILEAWKLNWEIPQEMITVTVRDGWVRLEGSIQWHYQKEAAEKAVENLNSVKGISNDILIISESKNAIDQSEVEHALVRNWSINNHKVHVSISGKNVTLTGTVSSLYQKVEAGRLAWNAPGVCSVVNELSVTFH